MTVWNPVIERAAEIVLGYDTKVTVRQLFYRLVSEQRIPNKQSAYQRLSHLTADKRRAGTFPALLDAGRGIERYQTWDDPDDARAYLADAYRIDRTEGQPYSLYLAVEKHGLTAQLDAWFGDLGVGIVALGGDASATLEVEVHDDAVEQGRPAVLLYAGDLDASGDQIGDSFTRNVERVGDGSFRWHAVERLALNIEQVQEYGLTKLPGKRDPKTGKATDPRAAAFVRKYGSLFQVELDALDPETLRNLYQAAIDRWWDEATYAAVCQREDEERATLE